MDAPTGSLPAADALEDNSNGSYAAASNHGWQKVTYGKRHRRQNQPAIPAAGDQLSNGVSPVERPNVFASVEQKAQERRRAIESAAVAASELRPPAAAAASDEDDDDSGAEGAGEAGQEKGEEVVKKVKQKKPKKPKVTVHEAASKIDASDLAAHLAEVSVSTWLVYLMLLPCN